MSTVPDLDAVPPGAPIICVTCALVIPEADMAEGRYQAYRAQFVVIHAKRGAVLWEGKHAEAYRWYDAVAGSGAGGDTAYAYGLPGDEYELRHLTWAALYRYAADLANRYSHAMMAVADAEPGAADCAADGPRESER